jgi:thiol-disulfide isomerase/thioredoxin
MKKMILPIFIIMSIVSCKEQISHGPMILAGKIKNPNWDSISICDPLNRVILSKKLSKNNTFVDTFSISRGNYYLCHGIQIFSMFLKPSYNLYVEFNDKSPDETINFKGDGANENNFLAKKQLFEKKLTGLNNFYLNKDKFLKYNDSLYNIRVNYLKSYKNTLEKDFIAWELKNYEFEKLLEISRFENMHQSVTNKKDFIVSEQFPDPYISLDFNNDQLAMSPIYLKLIDNYIGREVKAKINRNDSLDWSLGVLNIIEYKIKSLKIKELVCYPHVEELLINTKELDTVYKKLSSFTKDEGLLHELKVKYERMKNIHRGSISPDFSFYDIDNSLVTLNSLKGKVVYIDIWAPSCSPCMAEIPSLIQVEKDLEKKNIQFVSICMNDTKESWLKTVKEKKLKGIQIYAKRDSCSFYKDFSINAIPRFIILAKNGFIFDPNAMRPSNPKLKEELLHLLQ